MACRCLLSYCLYSFRHCCDEMKILGLIVSGYMLAKDHVPLVGLLIYIVLMVEKMWMEGWFLYHHVYTYPALDSLGHPGVHGLCKVDLDQLGKLNNRTHTMVVFVLELWVLYVTVVNILTNNMLQ